MLIAASPSTSPDWPTIVAAAGLLFAAIAAGCAAWAIREARASGREQHRATQQLQATVTTLGEVLTRATQVVELEGQALDAARSSEKDLAAAAATLEKVLAQEEELAKLQSQAIGEQRTLLREQRQATEVERLHREVDRLIVLGARVDAVRVAVQAARQGVETEGHVVALATATAAKGQLQLAIAAVGGIPVPQCSTLARSDIAQNIANGVDAATGKARDEVAAAIVATHERLRAAIGSED